MTEKDEIINIANTEINIVTKIVEHLGKKYGFKLILQMILIGFMQRLDMTSRTSKDSIVEGIIEVLKRKDLEPR